MLRLLKLCFNFLIIMAIVLFFLKSIFNINLDNNNKTWTAEVIRVADGDTVTVSYHNKTEKIRLLGVNSPETAKEGQAGQCYGDKASDFTHQQLMGQMIVIVDDSTKEDFDQYGRRLAYIEFKGQDYNQLLIEKGLAKEFTFKGEYYQRQRNFIAAEKKARLAKIGLWGQCSL